MCVIWRIAGVGRAIPSLSDAHVWSEHVCQVGFVGSYRYQPKAQKFRTELRPALFALLRSKTGGREGQTGGFANLPVGSDPPRIRSMMAYASMFCQMLLWFCALSIVPSISKVQFFHRRIGGSFCSAARCSISHHVLEMDLDARDCANCLDIISINAVIVGQ